MSKPESKPESKTEREYILRGFIQPKQGTKIGTVTIGKFTNVEGKTVTVNGKEFPLQKVEWASESYFYMQNELADANAGKRKNCRLYLNTSRRF